MRVLKLITMVQDPAGSETPNRAKTCTSPTVDGKEPRKL